MLCRVALLALIVAAACERGGAGVPDAGADGAVGPPVDGGALDGGEGTLDGGPGSDGGAPNGGAPDGGTYASLEDCCAALGCMTNAAIERCAAAEPAYGRCAIAGVAGVCIDTRYCGGDWYSLAGYCPGPANIRCCRPPSGSCRSDDRPLPNAAIVPVSFDARCPPGMRVIADAYCIDVHEAFLVEEIGDGGTRDWSPYFNPGTRAMRAVSAAGAVPQGYINANQAEAACRRAGKRLCTDAEWLRACRGAAGTIFPYGNIRQDGVCNDARAEHPAYEYFGIRDAIVFGWIDHPCLNQLAQGLDRTGANAGCRSPDGILDMMGNLHEWTSDPAGTFRGGFYVDTYRNGDGCLYTTTAHDRSHWDYSTGFRCCAELAL
jgi:hypothetical protein